MLWIGPPQTHSNALPPDEFEQMAAIARKYDVAERELRNETLFFTVRQARAIFARWVDDYNTQRPHASLGYATPAAFAAELEKQRAGLNPPVASPALLRDNSGQSLVDGG